MNFISSFRSKFVPLRSVVAFGLLFSLGCSFAAAQVPSPWVDTQPLPINSGVAGLKLVLRQLHTTARLMHTVAHPDDEDGGMLTLEARGHGVSIVQLTLNRGEGGQNMMGADLGDELGIVRTLELLSADRYYGVEQRFSRVADFGFSKNPEETFQKWGGHDVALADMVRVIRIFRPDVICTRFQGNARDGHGNHQASGILTREAFRAAADPNRFPEQIREGLQPWQAKKLYMDNVRGNEDWNVELETSQVDPVLGESYVQFAWKGLQHQLSQGAGTWRLDDRRRTSYYKLIDSALPTMPVSNTHEKDFFDGMDATLPGLASRLGTNEKKAPWLRPELDSIAKLIDEATMATDSDPQSAGSPLLQGLARTRGLTAKIQSSQLSAAEKSDLLVALQSKEEQLQQAANLALELELSAGPGTPDGRPLAEQFATSGNGKVLAAAITAGKSFLLVARFRNGGSFPVEIRELKADVPQGWKSELFMDKVPKSLAAGEGCSVTLRVTPPADAQITRAYFHRHDPDTDSIYRIDDPQYVTLPLPPPPVSVRVKYNSGPAQGEIVAYARTPMHDEKGNAWTMPLSVIPLFSIHIVPATQIIAAQPNPTSELSATVRSTVDHAQADVRVDVPSGWAVEPRSVPVDFSNSGEHAAVFKVLPDGAKEGRYHVSAAAQANGRDFSQGYHLVARPDIGGFFYYEPAVQRTSVVDVKVPASLKVGYIMGAGDDIPTVLREIGLDVTLLSPDDLARGDLSRFGTIVLGIRAYDTRDDVKNSNQRLLDYVQAGGTLLVQYNTDPAQFNARKFTPYSTSLSRNRVTVEDAPITLLDPANPVFHYPNQITQQDFSGWVQERGLYFMDGWDAKFTPLLAANDPGEPPQKGGLLMAQYGKGYYLYDGYAFFRQLPDAVPGAIRLYVNLLSVGHGPR
jgi:LmbE family N-acetylglucosaminyl deacetylase